MPIFLWSVVVTHSYRPLRYVAAGVSAVVAMGAPYFTVSVPVICWWTTQRNWYVPAGRGLTW